MGDVSTIKHLICDWDETLVHTLPTFKNAYDHIFDSLDMEKKSLEEIKTLTGGKAKTELFYYMLFGADYNPNGSNILATKNGFITLSPEQAKEIAEKARQNFYKYVEENHLKDLKLIEGAMELLEYCKNQKIQLHILSSKSPEFLIPEIKAVGLEGYFTNIYGTPKLENKTTDNTYEKPNIGSFNALFNGNPPKPTECCVIGDGNSDYILSQNIGCAYIPVDIAAGGVRTLTHAISKINEINRQSLLSLTKPAI